MDIETVTKWKLLKAHYNHVINHYNLTARDIYKQLGFQHEYNSSQLKYLTETCDKVPSNRIGSVGKILWDILISTMSKQDWSSSYLTYEELLEDKLDRLGISIRLNIGYDPKAPEMDIAVSTSNYGHSNIDIEYLQNQLTINGIVPIIKDVKYFYNI